MTATTLGTFPSLFVDSDFSKLIRIKYLSDYVMICLPEMCNFVVLALCMVG